MVEDKRRYMEHCIIRRRWPSRAFIVSVSYTGVLLYGGFEYDMYKNGKFRNAAKPSGCVETGQIQNKSLLNIICVWDSCRHQQQITSGRKGLLLKQSGQEGSTTTHTHSHARACTHARAYTLTRTCAGCPRGCCAMHEPRTFQGDGPLQQT